MSSLNQVEDYTQYVNPFIGTSKMEHVFPGATAPFGMVQLSQQTNSKMEHVFPGATAPFGMVQLSQQK